MPKWSFWMTVVALHVCDGKRVFPPFTDRHRAGSTWNDETGCKISWIKKFQMDFFLKLKHGVHITPTCWTQCWKMASMKTVNATNLPRRAGGWTRSFQDFDTLKHLVFWIIDVMKLGPTLVQRSSLNLVLILWLPAKTSFSELLQLRRKWFRPGFCKYC